MTSAEAIRIFVIYAMDTKKGNLCSLRSLCKKDLSLELLVTMPPLLPNSHSILMEEIYINAQPDVGKGSRGWEGPKTRDDSVKYYPILTAMLFCLC